MAHGRGNVEQAVQIALAAIAGAKLIQNRDVSVLYSDLIDAALSEASRKAFQMLPQGYEFQSETLRKNVAMTKAAAVVAVLEAREIAFSEEQKKPHPRLPRYQAARSVDPSGCNCWLRGRAVQRVTPSSCRR